MRLILLGLAGLAPALALAQPASFSIPEEDAARALLDFSKQSGVEVLFPYDELHRRQAHGVSGTFDPESALANLLQGTGYVARPNGRGSFVILAAPKPPAAKPAPGQTAPTVNSTERMAPFMVRGQADGNTGSIDAASVALGNLDLPRSENDALPYDVYSREQIARSGAVNLDDFLRQEVLESDAAALPEDEGGTIAGTAAYLDGSTNLNLRAYGSDETLVLINGLPMPENLSSNQNGASDRAADVNLIPINLVERVEILPVSAAALYSGNPVGGVINIVLRPVENIDEFTATYTNGFGRVDAPQSSFSLLHGRTLLGGKLSYRIDINYNRSMPPTEQELGFVAKNLAAHPLLDEPPLLPSPLYRATPNIFSESGAPLFGPGTPSTTSVAPGANGLGGLAAFHGRQGVLDLALFPAPNGIASSPDSSNYAYGQKVESESYFGTVTYDLFPWLQLGFDGLYSQKETQPGWDILQGNLIMASTNALNPFGQDIYVNLAETPPKLGEGYDQSLVDLYSAIAGLLVKLPHNWRITGDAQYSHTTTRYRGLAGVDQDSWQNLVNEGLYNPLRDTAAYDPPQAFYDQALIYFGHPGQFLNLDNYQSLDLALRVTQPEFHFPTGPGAITAGTDYNIQQLASYNDNQYYGDGELDTNTSGFWQGRTLQQFSAFAEVQAPLLPHRWLPSWIEDVSIDAAGRYNVSDTTFGSNAAPAFGAKVDFAGGFSLRGSVSNTNRFPTPSMSRFYGFPGGTGTGATSAPGGTLIVDPLRGDESYDVQSSDTPNFAVRPEADVTESVGFVWQHGDVHRFRLSVDMFDTRKSGELAYLDPQSVIEYEDYLPGRVTRATPLPGDPYGVGLVTSVLTGNINLAWRHSQNWNTAFDYDWNACAGGTLQVYARYVFFQRYDRELVPNAPSYDELEAPDTSGIDLVRHRINFGMGWFNHTFGYGVDGQYFSARILPQDLWRDQGSNHIDSYTTFSPYVKRDITSWIPWHDSHFRATVQARIDNAVDEPLPKFPDIPSGTGVEPYGDWRGRVYSLSVDTTF